jgi:pimeloyl-ACP methyl ester carboxylesterase
MKVFKKIVTILFSVLVVLIIGGLIYIDIKLPDLQPITNKIIDNALKKNSYKLRGEQGFAKNDETKIWYESIVPEDTIKGDIILIMGIANDALAWPDYFINSLVDSGYRVIRFDNRGTGLSDWMEDWSSENAYSLEDMADDAIAVLDTLQIEKAHVIGASLGGMIAQTISIRYPERVITLVSMMSTGDIMDKDLPSINTGTITDLMLAQIKYGIINSESNQIKLQITSRLILMGDTRYELDLKNIAESVLYNLNSRKGINTQASGQHIAATIKSGPRYKDLALLNVPTLVIHGKSDPLIDIKHGIKTFETIPSAEKLWIDGMGHDIPPLYSDTVVSVIINHIQTNIQKDE